MENEIFNIFPNDIIESIIAAYNPYTLLLEPIETLYQKDWKSRCKIVHSLDISEYGELSNDRWLFIYYNLCHRLNNLKIACSENHTIIMRAIIMRANGTLLSCGNNYYGQLGHGDNKNRSK